MSVILKIWLLLALEIVPAILLIDYAHFYDDFEDYDYDKFTMMVSGGHRPSKHTLAKYLVSIRTSKPTAYFGDNHFCTGVIIASKLILTAAHCIIDPNKIITRARRLIVVAGTPNRLREDESTIQLTVDAVIPHSKFRRSQSHDIAILRLKDRIPDVADAVKVISIADHRPKPGYNCTLLGWGQLFPDGPYSAEAVYVDLKVLNSGDCRRRYPHLIKRGTFCAADVGDIEKEACRGDSGAPLICNLKLYGIVSWRRQSDIRYYPTVFTDVYYHHNWIKQINAARKLQKSSYIVVIIIFILLIVNK